MTQKQLIMQAEQDKAAGVSKQIWRIAQQMMRAGTRVDINWAADLVWGVG